MLPIATVLKCDAGIKVKISIFKKNEIPLFQHLICVFVVFSVKDRFYMICKLMHTVYLHLKTEL